MQRLAILMAAALSSAAAADRYVVMVSIDGLAAFYFDDPRAHMPTLRRLAREGARAEGMVSVFPSVTWPSHTTLATGVSPARHGLLGNAVLDRTTGKEIVYVGDPELTKAEIVGSPTVYDVAHAAGLKTAGVIWPASAGAPSLDRAIPDSIRKEVLARHVTPGFADELEAAGIPVGSLAKWGWNKDYAGARDLVFARTTVHLLEKHRPNLTMLHLIAPDGHQHTWGPRSNEAYWAIAAADDRIRQIWDAMQQPPLAGKSTLVVVSDHGFAEYDRNIYPNVAIKEMGLEGKARFHSGIAGIYLLDRSDVKGTAAKLKARFRAVEGVDRVYTAEEFAALGLPDPEKNPRMADVMLSQKPGYSFSNDAKGTAVVGPPGERRGTHGHYPDQPFAHATFIAAGAGVKPGVKLGKISSKDVAPTVAAILGLRMPTAEGRVLREALR